MTPQEHRTRIKAFAYQCVAISESLPTDKLSTKIIANHLIRSAFSGASNYPAATRARSKPDFFSKLNIAREGGDESIEWPESIKDLKSLPAKKLADSPDESLQLVKILNAAKNTLQIELSKKNLPIPLPKNSRMSCRRPANHKSQITNHR